jgi:hypothetical protein
MQAARVDAAHAARHDHRLRGRAHDDRVELLAAGFRVLLRVVEPREGATVRQRQALQVEENGGREQRARQATAPGLVSARDEAAVELAVECEQPPTAALGRPRSLGRARYPAARAPARLPVLARGFRSSWAASRWRRPGR